MHREDYGATLILMLGFAAATISGFLREATLAHQLGAGRATDIYLVAFAVPEVLFLALPIVVTPVFIPLFSDLRLRAGERPAWRFGLRVALGLLILLFALTVILVATAPLYLRWLAPGFGPLERLESSQAMRLMSPAICLMGGVTLASAALQVYRRFARPALATAIYNLTFVGVLLLLPLAWPTGRAAWGVTIGASAALLLQLSLLVRFRPATLAVEHVSDGKEPSVSLGHVARLAAPLAVAYAVHHTILLIDRAMATTLGEGSVATLNYAYRLALAVGQVSGLAVSTALFPRMAEQVADGDRDGLRSSLAAALRFVWLIGLPACCGLVLLRVPLVEVLYERGAFDHAATAAVSDVLVWYAVAVLADALCQPLWRVLYAWRKTRTVLVVNGLQTGIRVIFNVALIRSLGYNGLALSAALGLTVQFIVLGLLVRRDLAYLFTGDRWRSAAKVVLATALAFVVAGSLANQFSAVPALVILLISGASGALVYLVAIRFLEKRSA
ncbi:MAG: lipid II flippase MurJ [Anaerolineae bacterium]|jgi:putative peptidoglycan lipid II flippase